MPPVVCGNFSELKPWRGHVPRYLPPVFDGVDHRRCFQLTDALGKIESRVKSIRFILNIIDEILGLNDGALTFSCAGFTLSLMSLTLWILYSRENPYDSTMPHFQIT